MTSTYTSLLRFLLVSSASLALTLGGPAPSPLPAQQAAGVATNSTAPSILMPIEVMGSAGTTQSVQVTVPSGANLTGSVKLKLQIHGLEYQTQASVQVNDTNWIPLNNANVAILGLGSNYGGIGGGFATLWVQVSLPTGTVQVGTNTLGFRFNGTDGNSSGFRVLNLNFITASGDPILPGSQFTQDTPANWVPPSTSPSDIAAGFSLYQTGALTQPVPGNTPKAIQAHCGDCHTRDGRDLKYFNYSNNSIYQRALFHGLNSTQANQIVSYIRQMSTPAPSQARPWNPPYQPGPGTDSQPVSNWAAGAGLSNVLSSDTGMLHYVSPTQTATDFLPGNNLSLRNIPIALQLMDWNHWLPRIHPLDAFGSKFSGSNFYTDYLNLRNILVPGDAAVYNSNKAAFGTWGDDSITFRTSVEPSSNSSSWSNSTMGASIYGINQWNVVKLWEINQEYELEGMSQTVFGPKADPRAWYSGIPFGVSPSIMQIPPGSPGIHNGSVTTFDYVSFAWYYSQLILNNSQGQECGGTPVDFAYYFGFVQTLSRESGPQAMLLLASSLKALQVQNTETSLGSCPGWDIGRTDPIFLVSSAPGMYSALASGTRGNLLNAYVPNWLAVASSFTPKQYYQAGVTTPNATVIPGLPYQGLADDVAYAIPRLEYLGLDSSLTTALINWASAMWPSNGYNWKALATATCTASSSDTLSCSSDR